MENQESCCKWSGKGIGVVNYRFVKSQLQSLFSGKKFSEKTVKIIKNKVKNIKSRVILNFFAGFFLQVSVAVS